MKRALILGMLLVGGLVGLLAFDGASTAYASGGPHGGYTATTDRCAGCHRAHSAEGSTFLFFQVATGSNATPAVGLCKSCHNGTGSELNVWDGYRVGYSGSKLLGGGFANIGGSTAVTTNHFDPSGTTWGTDAQKPWGYAGAGENRATYVDGTVASAVTQTGDRPASAMLDDKLECISCHNPHGTRNYRILKETINGYAVNVKAWYATTETPVAITSSSIANPTVITSAAHGFATGDSVTIAGHTGSVPDINGIHTVIVLSATTFTIPVNVTTGGTGGTVVHTYPGTLTANEVGRGLDTASTTKYIDPASSSVTGLEAYYSPGSNQMTSLVQGTNDANANIASFCSACHTAYPSAGAGVALTQGSVIHYRHKTEASIAGKVGEAMGMLCGLCTDPETDGINADVSGAGSYKLRLATNIAGRYVTCLTCHRAHGTDATVTASTGQGNGYADTTVTGGGGGKAGTGVNSKSRLLYLDNRGVCNTCHQWSDVYRMDE